MGSEERWAGNVFRVAYLVSNGTKGEDVGRGSRRVTC